MDTTLDIFADYARSFEARREADMSVAEYLEACRTDPGVYASAPERILKAIGEPQVVDTAKDPRLGRIFLKDRKSTRLNSSHANISYAVFCLKKKKIDQNTVDLHSHHCLL